MVADAAQHRIQDGLWCPTLDEILNALAHPTTPAVVQVGIAVYPAFESPAVAQTGIVPMPQPGEQSLGGHAVLCVGYSDARQALFFRNSWGSWGIAGDFWLPYAYAASNLLTDAWTLIP